MNWDSKKDFNRSLTLLRSKYFLILVKTVSFLFALMQILVRCSSYFSSLSIVISNSLIVLFSHIISSLILTYICSNLLPEIFQWHFSAFVFISLISNHFIASAENSSNFSRTYFKLTTNCRHKALYHQKSFKRHTLKSSKGHLCIY